MDKTSVTTSRARTWNQRDLLYLHVCGSVYKPSAMQPGPLSATEKLNRWQQQSFIIYIKAISIKRLDDRMGANMVLALSGA